QRSKNYLKKVIGIQISNDGWSKMKLYQDLRNYIVHSENILFENNDDSKKIELFKKLNVMDSVSVDQDNNIQLSSKFLNGVIAE
ncbi:MAG: hypothetical protein ACE5IR_29030, partial [bacterium]